MKIVYFLFITYLYFINCRDTCYVVTDNKKDCTDYELTESEKSNGDSCCFVKAKGTYNGVSVDGSVCQVFTKKDVPDLVKEAKKQDGVKSYSVDCSSNWISYSLFLIAKNKIEALFPLVCISEIAVSR